MIRLQLDSEAFALREVFTISRGSKRAAHVVAVTLDDGKHRGRGECVPYARYGESVDSVMAQIHDMQNALANGLDRSGLQNAMPPGAARNALDCALWDLEAKRSGQPVWQLAGLAEPQPLQTAYTLSLDTPQVMREKAAREATRPLLKLKLAGDGDLERVQAVREGAPGAQIIVDANEGWSVDQLVPFSEALAALGVSMIEQPLPADQDEALADVPHPVPVCADESCHDSSTLAQLAGRYDMVNIKLDKTGGLTEALVLAQAAKAAGLQIMTGCMVGSSLAMAPAMLIGQMSTVVDLDGPLLLARDREPGIRFEGSTMYPAPAALWG
ncbi:L-Ala-D/L-Glu epimerase [Granulosicoccaceae sp. 1_MG-2023]|nr:L-Ala-D/L-Glu epimerase [Granulosicoccaceae sp. 1_MG-2023]